MHVVQKAIRPLIVAAGVIGVLGVTQPFMASATTGPTYALPPSHYKVANKLEGLYRGQYIVKKVDRASRLSGGAMGIEVNDRGYLNGVGQFYGYDAQGFQANWTATLYNFHLMAHNVMSIDLLGPAGRPLLGRLYVQRAHNGDLSGQIELGSRKYAITWHKITNL